MARSYKARCIVLKKAKLGEADLIVTLLDESGHQLRAVAKGARKPGNRRFGARLEPFSVVDLVLYPGRSLEQVTEARCVQSHAACREDLSRSSACNLAAELLDKLTRDGEVGKRVFPMAQALFAAAALAEPERAAALAVAFALKAVALQGVRPALHACALCGTPLEQVEVFDVAAGGVLCPDCADASVGVGEGVSAELAGWVDALLSSTFAQVGELENVPVHALLAFTERWLHEHLGITLKTLTFLKVTL